MRITIAALLLLAAAGCSSKDGAGNGTAAAGASQAEAPVNLTQDPNNVAVPVTLPSPAPIAAVPAAYQGRWGMVGLDCARDHADIAKGLMTVSGDRLTFYESRGTATAIRQLGPGRIGFALAMSGEGQQWSEPTTLTIQEGGRTLLREATGSPDRVGSFTYQKCPD